MKSYKVIRWSAIILPLIILIIGGWVVVKKTNGNYRGSFYAAQTKIQSLISKINLLASQSSDQLQLIQDKQKNGDIKTALNLVIDEKERNRQINESAIQLTEELKQLAKLLVKFSNPSDRQKIETAIQYQINAINHLLNYGSGVDALLKELALKYESTLDNKPFEIRKDVDNLYLLIKQEIEAADANSQKFIQSLTEIK